MHYKTTRIEAPFKYKNHFLDLVIYKNRFLYSSFYGTLENCLESSTSTFHRELIFFRISRIFCCSELFLFFMTHRKKNRKTIHSKKKVAEKLFELEDEW